MAEAKFVINGRDYEIPGIDTFNLDEAMVLYHYSKLTLDQVADLEGVHPGVVAALLHVGIARAEPDARLKDIEKVVRAVSVMELIEKMEAATDDDAVDPPAAETAQPPIEPAPEATGENGSSGGETPQEASGLRAIGSPESAVA